MIAALYITTTRLVGKTADIPIYFHTLSQNVLDSPVVRLEQAILLFNEGQNDDALKIFREIYALDEDADFAREAENYIQFIESNNTLQSTQENNENQFSDPPSIEEDIPWWR